MLSVDRISKEYKADFWAKKNRVLDNVSFTIKENDFVGFLGANGAGKTTSMKIMLGLIEATEGQIEYDPLFAKNRYGFFSKVGYLPERPYFYPNLTGLEFLLYMGGLQGVPRKTVIERAKYWGERLHINFAFDRKIRGYSKGMLQRIGITSTLLHNPKLLIYDEPLSGVDPVGRVEIRDVMVELHKMGKSIFFSSHIVSDIEQVCKRVVVLDKGKLFYKGEINVLLDEHSKTNYSIVATNNTKTISLQVSEKEKDKKILELLNNGASISVVERMKVSLEEIIYNVRSDR